MRNIYSKKEGAGTSVATKTAIKIEMDVVEDMTDMGKDGIR